MRPTPQIIAICLVRDEDLFLDQVLTNVFDFCDRILIADHQSRDRTPDIGKRWAAAFPRVAHRSIRHAGESHEMIRRYADTPSWIFGVDGDELYDPDRLAVLRERILAGEYDGYRQIYGHALHCDEIDEQNRQVRGYLSPPCRTMTKLYNFGALLDWKGPCPERCHGGEIVFKEGYNEDMNCNLHKLTSWDDSIFRCLHVVFMRRSSGEPPQVGARLNISEKDNMPFLARIRNWAGKQRGAQPVSSYKFEKYRRGDHVTCDGRPFFSKAMKEA